MVFGGVFGGFSGGSSIADKVNSLEISLGFEGLWRVFGAGLWGGFWSVFGGDVLIV